MRSPLNQLAISVHRYDMFVTPLKCKVLLQDWQDPDPAFTLNCEQREVVEKFVYLGAGDAVGDEINSRTVKAKAAYGNLSNLWRLHDVSLAVKGRI
ncbi:unnamed protein product [Schistosoma mattheei]|uniref:Uncharacterized protein n=1 Tax=Schistosoma mattheei TaxID=31246 RepID=A0A183P254_9TREM|nr:unnamed protein product [Schistosoma mattheei]